MRTVIWGLVMTVPLLRGEVGGGGGKAAAEAEPWPGVVLVQGVDLVVVRLVGDCVANGPIPSAITHMHRAGEKHKRKKNKKKHTHKKATNHIAIPKLKTKNVCNEKCHQGTKNKTMAFLFEIRHCCCQRPSVSYVPPIPPGTSTPD